MIRALASDKDLVVNILAHSFDDNKTVNHIIPQDGKRVLRIKLLMKYAFDVCSLFGDVWLTEDKLGCALLIKPDLKRTALKSVLLDVKLAFRCLGLTNITKTMRREAAIKKVHPSWPLYHLWFIGVQRDHQNNGIGSSLMKTVIAEANKQRRVICLETSTLKNISWYEHMGFSIYHQFDFGYQLFCMKQTEVHS